MGTIGISTTFVGTQITRKDLLNISKDKPSNSEVRLEIGKDGSQTLYAKKYKGSTTEGAREKRALAWEAIHSTYNRLTIGNVPARQALDTVFENTLGSRDLAKNLGVSLSHLDDFMREADAILVDHGIKYDKSGFDVIDRNSNNNSIGKSNNNSNVELDLSDETSDVDIELSGKSIDVNNEEERRLVIQESLRNAGF